MRQIPPEALDLLEKRALAERAENAVAQPASRSVGSILGRVVLHCFNLLIAAGGLVAYQHFHVEGQSTPALVSLGVAGAFAFAPLRALLGELFTLERKALHLMHGVGALSVAGLALGGVISGGPVLNNAALAPFQIMGAAQAIMHQNHPRSAQQAEALRRFATSLPEVSQLTDTRNLASPQGAARAASVLADLISKAQALGATELQADPGFQSALRRATTRFGLTLGLDTIDQSIDRLAADPQAARQVSDLRKRLAKARRAVAGG